MVQAVKLGRYTLARRLATGGMAEVLLARQEGPGNFDRAVALKRILPHLAGCPEIVELFQAEARIAVRLCHPNIVQVHDFALIDGGHVLALEYVPGADLRALAGRARAPLGPLLVTSIAAAVCAALSHAHALGVVHGDVSPSNILVGRDGSVKLCDFGIAGQPGTAIVHGKRGYSAPEQRGGGELDGRADLYALGVVACELATGRRFVADAPLGGVPAALATVLRRAVEPEPERRYGRADEMLAELETLLGDHSPVLLRRLLAAEVRRRIEPRPGELGPEPDETTVRMAVTKPRRRGPGFRLYALAAVSAIAAAAAIFVRAGAGR